MTNTQKLKQVIETLNEVVESDSCTVTCFDFAGVNNYMLRFVGTVPDLWCGSNGDTWKAPAAQLSECRTNSKYTEFPAEEWDARVEMRRQYASKTLWKCAPSWHQYLEEYRYDLIKHRTQYRAHTPGHVTEWCNTIKRNKKPDPYEITKATAKNTIESWTPKYVTSGSIVKVSTSGALVAHCMDLEIATRITELLNDQT
jgi:hypothetical protein